MKRLVIILCIVMAFLMLSFAYLWYNNDIGITQNSIEHNARERQNIPDNWNVSIHTTKHLSAMIFYNDDKTEHVFSLYLNREGLSFGYFFYEGGIDATIVDSVREFYLGSLGKKAYLSMNSKFISRIRISNGINVETNEIDHTKPFVVIADDDWAVSFLDTDGEILY